MVTEIISAILNDLNTLLSDELSPHSITYRFKKAAMLLDKENVLIEKVDCKQYYEDRDLSLILLMKNEALANAQFELASKFCLLEKELLEQKGYTEFTQLKTEPFCFEYRSNRVIFHFNKHKENQRLIANLIEGYNIVHKKVNGHQMVYC